MSGARRLTPWLREIVKLAEERGGSTRITKDGHLLVLDAAGRTAAKFRTHGKKVGDLHRIDRKVRERLIARLDEAAGQQT